MCPVNPSAWKQHLMFCLETYCFRRRAGQTSPTSEHKRPSRLTGPEETTLSATEKQTRHQGAQLKQPRMCGSAPDFSVK